MAGSFNYSIGFFFQTHQSVAGNSGFLAEGSEVDLLVLTNLDQLLFILKMLFTFFTKQATLRRKSTLLSLSLGYLLTLTCLDELLLIVLFTFLTKQAILMRRSTY
jgi:hypothetical protein